MKRISKFNLLLLPALLIGCGSASNKISLKEGNEIKLEYWSSSEYYYKDAIIVNFSKRLPGLEEDSYKVTNDFDIKNKSEIKETNIEKSKIKELFFIYYGWLHTKSSESEQVYGYEAKAKMVVDGTIPSDAYVKFDYNPKLTKNGKVVGEGQMTITLKI